MNNLPSSWDTERCLVRKAKEQDIPAIASIFAENPDAVRSQGPDARPEGLASSLLHHECLPPGEDPAREQTFPIADASSNETIGLLNVYCGYPTSRTLYIGSLFFRHDWHGRGLGGEVVAELERHALQKGFRTMHALVGLKNWPALRFWVAMGFNGITGITGDDYLTESACADVELMKKLKGRK